MGSACVAGQSQTSFEKAFPQACWLSHQLLRGDRQSLCYLMATSSATRWGLWLGYLLAQQDPHRVLSPARSTKEEAVCPWA